MGTRAKNKSVEVKIRSMPFLLLLLIVGLLLAPSALSIPIPIGIDGTVYGLDGLTPVRNGVDYSITNLNNNEVVAGKTGRGSPGRYSATVGGNNGDILLVKAWNKYNSANFTIAANGVIHNAHFVLNMTYLPLAPTISTTELPFATEDELYSFTLLASDENEGDTLSYSLQGAPPGLWINSSTGEIRWTPSNDDVGNVQIEWGVSDEVHRSNSSLTLEIRGVNDAPEIFSTPKSTATEDILYQYDVDAIDIDSADIVYSLVQHPSGMAINGSSGVITWFPSNDDVGTYTVKIEASDGSLTTTQEFSLDVINVNDNPYFTSLPQTNATEDEPYTYTSIVQDPDSSAFAFSLNKAPAGMKINTTTGALVWLPDNAQVGFHNISITASDGEGNETQEFTITVSNVNDAPTLASSIPQITTVGQEYSYHISASDPDGDELSYILKQSPNGATINSASGIMRWKPKGNQAGSNSFMVEITDGQSSIQYSFDVFVTPKQEASPKKGGGGGGGGAGGKGAAAGEYSTQAATDKISNRKLETKNASSLEEGIMLSDEGLRVILSRLQGQEVLVMPDNASLVSILGQQPQSTVPLQSKVYKYIKIENPIQTQYPSHLISFRLGKGWLNESSIGADDVSLRRYVDGEWVYLATSPVSEDASYVYYLAETPGFSYFAITVKDGIVPSYGFLPESSSLKLPYTIVGTAFSFGRLKQVKHGIPLVLENLNTSEKLEFSTGAGNSEGGYVGTVVGKPGQIIKVTLDSSSALIALGDDSIIRVDFIKKVFGKGYVAIPRESVWYRVLSSLFTVFLILSVALLITVMLQRRFEKERGQHRKPPQSIQEESLASQQKLSP